MVTVRTTHDGNGNHGKETTMSSTTTTLTTRTKQTKKLLARVEKMVEELEGHIDEMTELHGVANQVQIGRRTAFADVIEMLQKEIEGMERSDG